MLPKVQRGLHRWALCVGKTVHKVSNTSLGLSVENRKRMEEEQVIGNKAIAKNIMEVRISVKSRACSGTLNVVRVSMRLVAAFALQNARKKPKIWALCALNIHMAEALAVP